MERLSEKEWKECDLSTVYDFDLAKGDIQLKKALPGHTPLVSAGFSDNGVVGFIETDTSSDVFSGNKLTIDMFGQPFYQPAPFQSVSHGRVNILSGGCISDAVNMFIVPCVKAGTASKYSYNQMCSQKRLQRQKVMLPVDDKGNPDYAYMTLYSTEVGGGMLMRYKNFIAGQLSQLEHKAIPALVEKEWKPVLISSMFELVRGRENNMAMLEDGDTPLISAKANNNGLKGFVHNPKKIITGQCITLNNDGDGGAGLAYYQPANMALDSHVTALVPLFDMSAFAMLFIAKCISGLHGFFGHGLSISNPRAKRLRIMLPVTDSGEPDYAYMEQYAKNMMLKKYKQYLAFIDRQSAAEEVNI